MPATAKHPDGTTIKVSGVGATMVTMRTTAAGATVVLPRTEAGSDIASGVLDAGDPHRWLEEVLDERALRWAEETNAATVAALGEPKDTEVRALDPPRVVLSTRHEG